MFEVKLMNNICIVWSFFSLSWERAGCFPLLFPYIYSDWFSSLLFVGWYDSSIPIASASSAAFCWNHHFGIQGDEICTFTKRIAYTFKWSYDILDTGKIPWMLDSVHDTCENRTWVSNVCPKIHPTCGPLRIMQASSSLGHCISVKPIMLPSQRSASCTWSWLRAENIFAVFVN